MKEKLKLTKLKKLNKIKGGSIKYGGCFCGCYYADSGGSSEYYNFDANWARGLSSPPKK